MVDERLVRMVYVLLRHARNLLGITTGDTRRSDPSEVFALACIARCADLLEGVLTLYQAGQWSVARVLGRTLIEFWLYGQQFLLGGEIAVDQLMDEDARHQGTLEYGRKNIWDRLESKRDGGIDLRTDYVEREGSRRQHFESLARRVRELREEHGYRGGVAEIQYEMWYRFESDHDVHPTFDLLSRYFRSGNGELGVVDLPEVLGDRDLRTTINDALRGDADLLSDLVGMYLCEKGDDSGISRLKADLADAAEE